MNNLLDSWTKINLPELQKTLDIQSLQLFSTQTQSLENRKRLAEQTKEFKKNANPEMADFKALLKEYQQEIDNINKRSKNAESAFLNLYKIFAEVPDPVIHFKRAMEQEQKMKEYQAVESENKRLKGELDASKAAINEAKAGLEMAKELQDRISNYESTMDSLVSQRVSELTAELKNDMDEKIKVYKETEYSLNRQLNQIKDQFTSLQSNQEFAQATSHTDHYDANIAAKLAEIDIMKMDLTKANSKLEILTRENYVLKQHLKESKDDSKLYAMTNEYSTKMSVLENEVDELEKKVSETESKLKQEALDNSRISTEKDREVATMKFELARLNTHLKEFEDYEEIKKELEIFKNMELGDDLGSHDGKHIPLERLLLEKNKKLETANTTLKMDCNNLNDTIAKAQSSLDAFQSQLVGKNTLISKLEADILRLNDLQSRSSQSPEHLESLMSDFQANLRGTSAKSKQESSSSSLVPILTSQRDRYKQRFEESHRSSLELSAKLSSVEDTLSKVQQDNVSLYQKLKYQESYRGGSVVNMESSSWRNDAVSARYRDKYEESIDPFRHFKQQENRRAQNLNPADRVAMQITKLLTSNKYSRLVIVVYAVALHILVFVALLELMSATTTSPSNQFSMNKPDS